MLRTAATLGADASHLEAVLKLMTLPPAKYLPFAAQKALVTQALDVGRSQFRLLNSRNPVSRTSTSTN